MSPTDSKEGAETPEDVVHTAQEGALGEPGQRRLRQKAEHAVEGAGSAPLSSNPTTTRRRWFDGLAPAALLIPLVIVSLVIYFAKPSWLAGQDAATPAATAVESSPLPTATPPSIAAAAVSIVETPAPLSTEVDEYEGLLAQGRDLALRSKFEQAIEILEDLTQQKPDDPDPEIEWTRVLLWDSLPAQALLHAQRAVSIDPTHAEAAALLAQAYLEVGDRVQGLAAAENAVRLDPNSADARSALALAYLLNGDLAKSEAEVERALALDVNSAESHRIRARLYDTLDALDEAVGECRRAVNLQPDLWLRHYELGLQLLRAEEYESAVQALTDAWVLRRKPMTYSGLGEAYYRSGDMEQAASYLEQALSAGAINAETFALLSDINQQRGRCTDAIIYVNEALARDPNHPLALEVARICGGGEPPAVAALSTAEAGETAVDEATPLAESSGPPSPLSGRIAFPVWNGQSAKYDTVVAAVDGSQRTVVAEQMHQPAWSPNGQWLMVNGERHEHLNLFLVQPDGTLLGEVTKYVEDSLPAWSPDSRSAVFSSSRHSDKQSRIYIIDQIPHDGSKAQDRVLNTGSDDVRGESPAWTGDGRIVYAGCHYESGSAQCGLLSISSDPGPQPPQQLTDHPEDTAPAAYGDRVAFMSNRDGNWEIYVVNSDGTGFVRLTHDSANDGLPTWSPDGRSIAFVSDRGGIWAVWAVNPDGSDRRKLFDLGGEGLAVDWLHEQIAWGP